MSKNIILYTQDDSLQATVNMIVDKVLEGTKELYVFTYSQESLCELTGRLHSVLDVLDVAGKCVFGKRVGDDLFEINDSIVNLSVGVLTSDRYIDQAKFIFKEELRSGRLFGKLSHTEFALLESCLNEFVSFYRQGLQTFSNINKIEAKINPRDLTLEELDLTVRLYSILRSNKIHTLGDLLDYGLDNALLLKNLSSSNKNALKLLFEHYSK